MRTTDESILRIGIETPATGEPCVGRLGTGPVLSVGHLDGSRVTQVDENTSSARRGNPPLTHLPDKTAPASPVKSPSGPPGGRDA
jgi:hypothetical protein